MTDAILAIRPRALGDVVLTTPALRALHRGAPGAAIDVVTDARYAPLLEGLPGVDRVIPLAGGRTGTWRTLGSVRRRRYARAVDFFGNPRTALLTAFSGAGETVGWDVRGRRLAYRRRVPRVIPGGEREYSAAAHLRLALAAGGVADGLESRVTVPPRAVARAAALLAAVGIAAPDRTLGLVAAGTWGTKTWPVSEAAGFARRLLAGGTGVLVLAGPGEALVTAALERLAPGIAVLPPCDVPELAAVIARLRGVVGTDSGPRHLAAALGRPTFAWFGPTHPDHWTWPDASQGVWRTSVPCRGCNLTACPHWTCLAELDAGTAAALVGAHFDRHAAAVAGDRAPVAAADSAAEDRHV